ncbi:excisionase family DNA-binding protein [Mycobacterium sp. 852002-51961_SCH5331710]|uniref:excisionase family DNA-binding protein n=1 Tax=Mycobacterium sp. 852002-51961_SCH5331710 TaxID=1834105 RepID=UPI0007FF9580|nr:excisionase family DNA-binding protein [Mycobacterium sp. 852002-51961_SCH5331710]OBB48413.1 DNA-binding protein [Mycobacterium sp. 852002-51961_SCH5331710]
MALPQTSTRPAPPEVPNRAARRRRYATVNDAADYIGVSDRTIRKMIVDGRLTGYRSGTRLVRVDLNEIDDSLMQSYGGAVSS